VTREIERLDALIGDILEFTNPRPRQVVRLDLQLLVEETVTVFRQDPALGAVSVATSISPGPFMLEGDPGKLRQVVWNLVRNAAEAASQGGNSITIAVRREVDRGVIEVDDDGPGISADILPRIFDPFFTTKPRGTGLGLATTHSIVVEHGGTIEAERGPGGKGTRFVVRLPLEPAPGP
jgi:signal transduction histidine kinase